MSVSAGCFRLATRLLIRRRDWRPPDRCSHVSTGSRRYTCKWARRSFFVTTPRASTATSCLPSELVAYDGVFLGWQMLDGLLPEARQALQHAAQFVRHCLAADT